MVPVEWYDKIERRLIRLKQGASYILKAARENGGIHDAVMRVKALGDFTWHQVVAAMKDHLLPGELATEAGGSQL